MKSARQSLANHPPGASIPRSSQFPRLVRRNGQTQTLVVDRATGTPRPAVADPPFFSTSLSTRRGFVVERMKVGAFNQHDIITLTHLVVLQVDGVARLQWKADGPFQEATVLPGQVSLVPAHVRHSVLSECLGEYITVSLHHGTLLSAAAEARTLEATEIPLTYGVEDPLLREVIASLADHAASANEPDDPYATSLVHLLAVHVLRRYSRRTKPIPVAQTGLTRLQLREVLDFVQANLVGDLPLARMAAIARLSPCHFARLFSAAVGMPPHRYVLRCRVELARSLLSQPFSSLADVAVQSGFCDQSHLTRHFTRYYGLTPGAFVRKLLSHKVQVVP